jgi:hypothetical protein
MKNYSAISYRDVSVNESIIAEGNLNKRNIFRDKN